MEPKQTSAKVLKAVFIALNRGSEKAIGTYLFKGYRVQVSKYQSSGTERSAQLYRRRREMGFCVRCGAKVTKKNPLTGKLYRLCDDHRTEIDRM